MENPLPEYRALFPITRSYHFLNHAAVAPAPTCVRDAVQAWMNDLVNHGMAHLPDWIRREREVRASAARLLGCTVDEIAFVRSTSHGLGMFAEGLAWQPGDEVAVCTELEYPANVYPWMHLRDRGVVVRPIEAHAGGVVPEAVVRALGPRTRVVSLSTNNCHIDRTVPGTPEAIKLLKVLPSSTAPFSSRYISLRAARGAFSL